MYIAILLFVLVLFFILTNTSDKKIERKIKRILNFEEVSYREKFSEEIDEYLIPCCEESMVTTSFVESKYANEKMKYIVVRPKEIAGKDYPCVLFLHGIRDEANDWIAKGRIVENYEACLKAGKISEMVLVIPDSGNSGESWYADFEKDENKKYESYLVKELIPEIKKKYPIGKIGIAGFSMGGHGALKVALRNIEVFTAIGSFAGAISLIRLSVNRRVMRMMKILYIPKFAFNSHDKKTFLDVFGSFGYQIIKQDPYTLIKDMSLKNPNQLKDKCFYLSVGDEDKQPYLMLQQWIDIVGRLKKFNLKFHATLYRGEAHTWEYVSKDLPNLLEYFNDKLK